MDLLGRSEERDRLRALLDDTGAAVIVGPPGIGKTALAAAFDGAVWVDLEGVETPDALQARLARALACPVDRPGAVHEALRGHDLVVLDGAEGCLPAVVARRRALAAATTVLVTTRRRPPSPGLDWPVLELGPLDPESGAALMRQRVGSARQAEVLDDQELRALSSHLDGVPLALELVAMRLRLHAPATLMGTATVPDDPERLPARLRLGAEIRTSVVALGPGARQLLALAAQVEVPLDAAQLAGAAGRDTVDADVLELLDAALLHPIAGVPPRFRVLAPIRAVARDGVDDATVQAALVRLAADLWPIVEDPATEGDASLWRDAVPLLERLLASPDPRMRLRAAIGLARHRHWTGNLAATLQCADDLDASGGPPDLALRWATEVASAASTLGRIDLAWAALREVEPRSGGDPAWISMRGTLRADEGDFEGALRDVQRARASSDHPWLAFREGAVWFHQGSANRAVAPLREAQAITSPFRKAQATYALCAALRESGAPSWEIEAELEAHGDRFPWLQPRFTMVRAILRADEGDLDEAIALTLDAARRHREHGEDDDEVQVRLVRVSLELALARVPEEILRPLGTSLSPRVAATLDTWRAVVHAALGHVDTARALGLPALEALARLDGARAREQRLMLAVALGPGGDGAALLEELPADDPERERARALLEGQPVEPPERLEGRVLMGLAAIAAARVRVARDGSGLVAADGTQVDLSRRKVLRRMLATLAQADAPLDVPRLCAAVWPGERLIGQSGTRRVHVAISTLRGLGLRAALVTARDPHDATTWRLCAQVVDEI